MTDVAAVLLAEQTQRYRAGRCLYCGIPLELCWCGENEPREYVPAGDGSDDTGAE